MENYFRLFFENLTHTPKEFGVKYYQKNSSTEIEKLYSLSLTFSTDFFSNIEPDQFHTNDLFTGDIINIGGIIHYNNQKYIRRYFVKGNGKSHFKKDDIYLFHKPFGENYRECYSKSSLLKENNYMIENLPLGEVIGEIRKLYIKNLDKSIPFNLVESFQFESLNLKYTVDFFSK